MYLNKSESIYRIFTYLQTLFKFIQGKRPVIIVTLSIFTRIVTEDLNPVDIAFFYLCLEHHKRLRQLFLSETRQKLQAHSSIRCQLLGEKSRKRLTQAVSVHGFQQITGWLQRQHLHDTLLIPLTGQEHHRRRRQFVG